MNKQNLFGWLLLTTLFVGWFYYNNTKLAKKQELAKQEAIKDSIVNANNSKTVVIDTAQVQPQVVSPSQSPDTSNNSTAVTTTTNSTDPDTLETTSAQEIAEEFFVIEDDDLKLTLSNKGGRIVQAEVKGYTSYANFVDKDTPEAPILLYSDTTSQFNWQVQSGTQLYNTENIVFNGEQNGNAVTFNAMVNGKPMQQTYALTKKPFIVDYKVNFPDKASDPLLTWQTNFKRQEKDMRGEKEFTFFAYKTASGDFKKLKAAKKDFSKTAEGSLHFLVQRQRFFSQTIFSANQLKDATFKSSYVDKDDVFSKKLTTTAGVDLTNGSEVPFSFYIGPNERKLLKTIDKDLVNILPKGVLGLPLVKWISGLFKWMMPLSGNMGLLILLMTVIIKLALSPLTYKSYLSQAKMQMLKPELEELRAKFGKDQQKMSQEQMKLYSKAGVNPVGGCLPTLLQIPIFFSLYYFFRTSIFFRQEPFLWAKDLSTYDTFIQLPFEIPVLSGFMGTHISLFAVLYGVALFLSMRFTQSMNGGMTTTGGAGGDMMKTQMKIMQWGMPIFLPLIFNMFPAALTFYYFVYNIINVIQTLVIKKFIINEDKIKQQIATNKKKVKKKSKFQQRLEDAMKQQQAQQKNKKK